MYDRVCSTEVCCERERESDVCEREKERECVCVYIERERESTRIIKSQLYPHSLHERRCELSESEHTHTHTCTLREIRTLTH